MDAIKFLEERARMCGHGCKNSKVYGEQCDIYTEGCDYESLVETVEAWAAAHPRKTRQSVFLEQWPNVRLDTNGLIDISPCRMDPEKYPFNGKDCCKFQSCGECRREFWMQEVE